MGMGVVGGGGGPGSREGVSGECRRVQEMNTEAEHTLALAATAGGGGAGARV